MKKFRFLIFTLILTSMFIGCAQPTDDPVTLEVPKNAQDIDWKKKLEAELEGYNSYSYQVELDNYKVEFCYKGENINYAPLSKGLYLDNSYQPLPNKDSSIYSYSVSIGSGSGNITIRSHLECNLKSTDIIEILDKFFKIEKIVS